MEYEEKNITIFILGESIKDKWKYELNYEEIKNTTEQRLPLTIKTVTTLRYRVSNQQFFHAHMHRSIVKHLELVGLLPTGH